MRLCMLWTLVFLYSLGCSGPPQSMNDAEAQKEDSRAFIDWVSDHAIGIEGEGLLKPLVDEKGIRDAIGQARVVGLGESRHDTREQLLLKGRLVRYLVENMEFRALILEESFPHAETLDAYVTTGKGDLRIILNHLAGWYLWDTEEMHELVSWIRSFNEGRDPGDQIRIFGVDITAPALGVGRALDFLRSAEVDFETNDLDLGLDLQEGDFWPTTWQRYSELSEERKAAISDHYDSLISIFDQQRSLLSTTSSEAEYERTRLLADIGRQGHRMFSTSDRAQGGAIREHGMAQTLLWILEHKMGDSGAILWAHNLHVATSSFRLPGIAEGDLEPMGMELARELGDAYVAVGACFGSGSYPPDLPPGERSFEVMAEHTMDGALAGVSEPVFLIDLREAAQNSAAATWLQKEREWRAQDSDATLVPGEAFDLVYFVGEVSRSQPTPFALERFQELQRQQ